MFPLRGDNFLQGGASPGVPPALLSPRSSVRRRAMFLVMDKAGLSGEGEQKCGTMFNCSSRIKRRVERRNEQSNLLPRLRHTLSRIQWLVLFSQRSQSSHISISSKWEQSIEKREEFEERKKELFLSFKNKGISGFSDGVAVKIHS